MLKVSMVLTVDFESVLISSKLIWEIPFSEFRPNKVNCANSDSGMVQIK